MRTASIAGAYHPDNSILSRGLKKLLTGGTDQILAYTKRCLLVNSSTLKVFDHPVYRDIERTTLSALEA